MEVALVNYLVLLTRVVTRHVMTTAELDDLFDQLCRKTLGTNIRAVKRLLGEQGGDWVSADQMTDILKLGNELVHHWMRKRAMRQQTSVNRLAMIAAAEAGAGRARGGESGADRTHTEHAGEDRYARELLGGYARLTELAERGEDDPDAPSYWDQEGWGL